MTQNLSSICLVLPARAKRSGCTSGVVGTFYCMMPRPPSELAPTRDRAFSSARRASPLAGYAAPAPFTGPRPWVRRFDSRSPEGAGDWAGRAIRVESLGTCLVASRRERSCQSKWVHSKRKTRSPTMRSTSTNPLTRSCHQRKRRRKVGRYHTRRPTRMAGFSQQAALR
jgi:hypothetical protein